MFPIHPLQSFEQLKLLADPRRLKILRILMSAPASLTGLGQALGEHPAWVRHHLKQLVDAGLVELAETRVQSGVVEKFYRARAGGFLLQQMILPENPAHPAIVFSGSHDLAIELLATKLAPHLDLLTMPVGSLDGLVALRQNLCQVTGCHLLDISGEYNLPFVRHLFPDRSVQVVTLAHREQGLMTAPGNPKSIRVVADLARAGVTLANRNPGSGTRLWLDQQLAALGISPSQIKGYDSSIHTHTKCARLVQSGAADAAVGLRAAAERFHLGFQSLFQERYDLIFPAEMEESLLPILDTLQLASFHREMENLAGYAAAHAGEQISH